MVYPDESAPHKRSWMSYIASDDIWSKKQIAEVQRNLEKIAKTLANYEPVTMLVRRQDYPIAMGLLGKQSLHKYPIDLIEFNMNDLWMRDTGPAFVINRRKGVKA
ncbi:MAG: agmatine deiminase family protein [Methylococcales bacterium]